MGSWNGSTFSGFEYPPTPPFYRQKQLSSREGKSISEWQNRGQHSNNFVFLPSCSFSIFTLLICSISLPQPPSAKYIKNSD